MLNFTVKASRILLVGILAFLFGLIVYAAVDGFDFPVGAPDGDGYNNTSGWGFLEWTGSVFHPGEDWNGNGGGDSDYGDPVYASADGIVIAADNYCAGWGNIVLIEHTLDNGNKVWTQYAHLKDISTSVDSFVYRGDKIGTIGKGCNDEYLAHLHFEIRHEYREPDAWVEGWGEEDILDYYYEPTVFIDNNRPGGEPPLPVINVSGTISEDTTWQEGYVYLVQSGLTVEKGVTLTLEPGVIVKFQYSNSRFDVYGHLSVEGSDNDKVYFTSYKDDTVGGDSNADGSSSQPSVDDWENIAIHLGAVADIDNAVIRYGGRISCNSNNACNDPGAILVSGGVLIISDSTFSENRHSIYLKSPGYANISGSLINNSLEDGIRVTGDTVNLTISYSVISQSGGSGIKTYYPSNVSTMDLSVSNSTISQNGNYGIYASAEDLLEVTITDTDFISNQSADALISSCQYYGNGVLNFINSGNSTIGTGGNGFQICNKTFLEDQIWNPGVPFMVSSVIVPVNVDLNINPGAIIKFLSTSSNLNITGTLNAQGTTQNKIYFTSYKDDNVGGDSNGDGNATTPAPEDYVGIRLNSNGVANISNTVLRYGGRCQGENTCQQRGVITNLGDNSILNLSSSELSKNNYGVFIDKYSSSTNIISNSIITESTNRGINASNNYDTVNLSILNSTISKSGYEGIYVSTQYSNTDNLNISVVGTAFKDNQQGDIYIGTNQGRVNFINSSNTTGGTGKNGFFLGGSILGDQIWNPGVPFISGITVPLGTSLTIKPGTVIKFPSSVSDMEIRGSLYAYGRSANPNQNNDLNINTPSFCQPNFPEDSTYELCGQLNKIYFTSYKDDNVGGDSNGDGNATAPAPEDYVGVIVNGGVANISNAVFLYGGNCQGQHYCYTRGVLSSLSSLSNTNITSSLISNNGYGIYRSGGNVSISGSSIKDSTYYGILHTGSGTNTQAQNNWWGDSSGPYHPIQNPGGQGDAVSNDVDFVPWLISDPL